MRSFESPKYLFDFMTKWMPQAPPYCVYDNACRLADYCYRRNPSYFKHCRFWCVRMSA